MNRAVGKLSQHGVHKSLKKIFAVRKEWGEEPDEFIGSIKRKICFDLELPSLSSMGTFDLRSSIIPDKSGSGVVAFQIAKSITDLLWIRVGERCQELQIKIGETRLHGFPDGDILEEHEFRHVTEDMVKESLRKYVGLIKLRGDPTVVPGGEVTELPALCHEIQVRKFDPPFIGLWT
ncbi:uncharacterized protein LOC100900086 [Galendromus occidentalis]|uniref:Uncharacterized protein LOC100900086 n=1 Tax=Galendromus occidentalis TaxID=34638 RepID=A0AAJ6QM36_9ACAR|nr:uncharacterized protein LOC100900086 [Galendromus occidentalis]